MPSPKKALRAAGLKDGGKFVLTSVIVEALLLAPKTTVKLGDKEYLVGGVFPMLQKEIATGVRDTLNRFLPKAAGDAESFLRGFDLKEKLLDKAVWFIYDYMEPYTLETIVSAVLTRAGLENTQVTGLLRGYLTQVLSNKDDREKLVDGLTDLALSAVGIVLRESNLSAFVNAGGNNLRFTISDVLDRALQSEAGEQLIDRLLEAVEQFETMNLAGFLEFRLGMTRADVEQWIDDFYERYVGTEMVGRYSNLGLGDSLYWKIAGMDYDKVFQDITQNHLRELVQVTMTAAGIGAYVMSIVHKKEAKAAAKQERKENKATKKAARKAAKKAKKKR